jgi:hypothetical protein
MPNQRDGIMRFCLFKKNTNGAFDQAQGRPFFARNFNRQLAQTTVLA